MRRLPGSALLIAALLLLALLAPAPSVAGHGDGTSRTASSTTAKAPKKSTLSLRFAPATVTVYENGALEPTAAVAQVNPAVAGRPVTIQRLVDGAWTTVRQAATDTAGRVYARVLATEVGKVPFRARVATSKGYRASAWKSASLAAVSSSGGCNARVVDPAPTGELVCLAARLDRWKAAGVMGLGQQVNISQKDTWTTPLDVTPAPAIVGFDLQELDQAATAEYPYVDENVAGLLDRAHQGAVLVASWHATNPFTGAPYNSPRRNLKPLLTPGNAAYDAFWADWDRKLDLLLRFQRGDADGDGMADAGPCLCTAVVVRPLHEVNGDFFWWGKPDPATYKKLFARLQSTARAKGVHNVLWGYSGNRDTSSTTNPATYVPAQIDLGGLDAYDPEQGKGNAVDEQPLEGYSAIARAVPRMALTEVGPHGSADRKWNPAVIWRTVKKARITPLWAMLWFDDGTPAQARQNGVSGYKQFSSLIGGPAFLRSCVNATCIR